MTTKYFLRSLFSFALALAISGCEILGKGETLAAVDGKSGNAEGYTGLIDTYYRTDPSSSTCTGSGGVSQTATHQGSLAFHEDGAVEWAPDSCTQPVKLADEEVAKIEKSFNAQYAGYGPGIYEKRSAVPATGDRYAYGWCRALGSRIEFIATAQGAVPTDFVVTLFTVPPLRIWAVLAVDSGVQDGFHWLKSKDDPATFIAAIRTTPSEEFPDLFPGGMKIRYETITRNYVLLCRSLRSE